MKTTLVIAVILALVYRLTISHQNKMYIQKRQWAREDREMQIQYERQQMDLALKSLRTKRVRN